MSEAPKLVPISALAEINPRTVVPHHVECSFIGMEDVSEEGQWIGNRTRPAAQAAGYTTFRDNDILFAKITPCMENGKGALVAGLKSGYGIGSTEFHVIRAKGICDHRFLAQWMHSRSMRAEAAANMTGSAGQRRVPKSFFDIFHVPFFPLPEQRRIAAILDAADEALCSTKQLIAKLGQVRHGLVGDLLSRGINSAGRLRDPGLGACHFHQSRLGLLPESWTVCEIGAACSLVVDCPHTTPVFRSEGILVARTANIKDGSFILQGASYVDEQEYQERTLRAEPQAGDLVFTREAPVGEAFVVPPRMRICLGQRVMLLRPDPQMIDPIYLLAQIYSGFVGARIRVLTAGTTNPHLNVGEIRKFLIPVPPLSEQRQIARVISQLEREIKQLSIELEKSRLVKQGLIDDLLTGRVRVGVSV